MTRATRSRARRGVLLTAVGLTLAGVGLLAPPAAHSSDRGAPPPARRELLRRVREAVRPYRDVAAAKAAGYVAAPPCRDDPKYGAMGVHYGNPRLLADPALDPLRPEVLVYQPAPDGRLRLGAVEYFRPDADQNLATDGDRPSLFGLPFDGPMLGHDPGMPIHYDLHVWLFRPNPAGTFAMWNPTVHCPEGER